MKFTNSIIKIALIVFIFVNCSISSYSSYKLSRTRLPSKDEVANAEAGIKKKLKDQVIDCSEYVKDVQVLVDSLIKETGEKRACELNCKNKELFEKYVLIFKTKEDYTPRDFIAALGESSQNPFYKCADSKYFLKLQNKKSKLIAIGTMSKLLSKNKNSTEDADEKKVRAMLDGKIYDCSRYADSITKILQAFIEREMKNDPSAKNCKFICAEEKKFKLYVDAFKTKNDAFENKIEKWVLAFGESSSPQYFKCD